MPLYEIVLRRPHKADEVQLRDFAGWTDGSSVAIDGQDWFVMMQVKAHDEAACGRLICVRADPGEALLGSPAPRDRGVPNRVRSGRKQR